MTKQIAKLLKATIQESSDLKQIAKQLAQKGRGGDSMLVHITPREASMLKDAGGAGTINPDTGLMEFYQGEYDLMKYAGSPNVQTGGYTRAENFGYSPSDFDTPVKTTTPSFQDTYSLVPDNYVPNPKTGGYVSPDTADVGGQYGLRFGKTPRAGNLVAPIDPKIRLQQQLDTFAPPMLGGTYTNIPEVEAALSKQPSVTERIKANLTSPDTLEKLGIAGLQSLPAIIAARQSAAQGRQAKEELQAMAAPYKQRGEAMVQQAERGELTPVEQHQIQALRARAAQGAAGRGGVGAEQAAVQEQAFLQQLLANKYDMGLKIANIGDQIAAGAIRTGLQADQYVNELTSNYFTTLARSMGGQAPFTQPQQIQQPR
jgi:hypothetical protein